MTDAAGAELRYRRGSLDGVEVGVTSYKIGNRYASRVDNVDPGSIIGRGGGPTREAAESIALEKASLSLDLVRATQALRRSVDHLPSNADRAGPSSSASGPSSRPAPISKPSPTSGGSSPSSGSVSPSSRRLR